MRFTTRQLPSRAHEEIWSTPPRVARSTRGALEAEAVEGSDFWEKTAYEFQHRTGHALLASWDDREAVEVTFHLDGFAHLYDQAGLMLWHGPAQWVKAGVEVSDGIPHVGAVVTHDFSDWSLAPVPDWVGARVTIRASRFNDAVIIRARTEDHGWRMVRVAHFAHDEETQAGPFLCSPTRSGFQVTFTRWVRTAPDTHLHSGAGPEHPRPSV